jgi:HPt (histidine-containing phosphotransfer) domain-containing protein
MALLGRCLGNFKIVERVIATFQETGRSDLDQLQMAVEQTDYAAVVEIAHRFKGAASNVSAVGLSKALLRAEVAGREVDHPELVKILADLQSEWDIFMRFAHAFAPATSSAKHGSVIPTQDTSEKRHACASC